MYDVICVGIVTQVVAFDDIFDNVKTEFNDAVEVLDGKTNFWAVIEPIEALITRSVIVVGVPDTFDIKVLRVLL